MKQTSSHSSPSFLKAELTKIRNLPKGKRWEYIWEYYRLTFFLVAFALLFLGMIGSFLVNGLIHSLNPKEPISIAFATSDFSNCETWMDSCMAAIGYDESGEDLQVLAAQPHSDTSDTFRINTSVWLVNGQPDIFVVDEASYQYLLELEALADIREAWPEDLQRLAEQKMASPYALEISGTTFAEAYGISGAPVYLCMYQHGNGFLRALDIVRYILTET